MKPWITTYCSFWDLILFYTSMNLKPFLNTHRSPSSHRAGAILTPIDFPLHIIMHDHYQLPSLPGILTSPTTPTSSLSKNYSNDPTPCAPPTANLYSMPPNHLCTTNQSQASAPNKWHLATECTHWGRPTMLITTRHHPMQPFSWYHPTSPYPTQTSTFQCVSPWQRDAFL